MKIITINRRKSNKEKERGRMRNRKREEGESDLKDDWEYLDGCNENYNQYEKEGERWRMRNRKRESDLKDDWEYLASGWFMPCHKMRMKEGEIGRKVVGGRGE